VLGIVVFLVVVVAVWHQFGQFQRHPAILHAVGLCGVR